MSSFSGDAPFEYIIIRNILRVNANEIAAVDSLCPKVVWFENYCNEMKKRI